MADDAAEALAQMMHDADRLLAAGPMLGHDHDEGYSDSENSSSAEENMAAANLGEPGDETTVDEDAKTFAEDLNEYEAKLRRAIEAKRTGAPAQVEGEKLDGVFSKIKDKITGKKRTDEEKAARAQYEADKKAAKAKMYKTRKAKPPADATSAPASLGDLPEAGKLRLAPSSLLGEPEKRVVKLVDEVVLRQYSLAAVEKALASVAPGTSDHRYHGALAAAAALTELRGEAEAALKVDGAALKKTADIATTARKVDVPATAAADMAAHLAALGASAVSAEDAQARGRHMAAHLRSTAAPAGTLAATVAALADVVRLLQNRATGGTMKADTELRLKQFWAASGTLKTLRATALESFL